MTPVRRPRLLVTARDAAASEALAPIVKKARAEQLFQTYLVADDPAYSFFLRCGLDCQRVGAPDVANSNERHAKELLSVAKTIFDRIHPDLILTGSSGLNAGIDEAMHVAGHGKAPTVALQDFWGDVNLVFDTRADNYLVGDSLARDITVQRTKGARVHVVGFTRYAQFKPFDVATMRFELRKRLGLKENSQMVALFTQPLWFLDGYPASWLDLLDAIAEVSPAATLAVCPHPRDSRFFVNDLIASVRARELKLVCEPFNSMEAIVACDIGVSAFSTTGIDHSFLLSQSKEPAGVPLFLQISPDVRRYFQSSSLLDQMPTTVWGASLTASDSKQLNQSLHAAFARETRVRVWRECRKAFGSQEKAVENVFRVLNSLV